MVDVGCFTCVHILPCHGSMFYLREHDLFGFNISVEGVGDGAESFMTGC